MDTSPEYIKMFDCPEIQDGHVWKEGDYAVDKWGAVDLIANVVYQKWDNRYLLWTLGGYKLCGKGVYNDAYRFAPVQSQLQEMLLEERYEEKYDLCSMFAVYLCDKPDVMSMEQLWLMFVMHEKGKHWNGEAWE